MSVTAVVVRHDQLVPIAEVAVGQREPGPRIAREAVGVGLTNVHLVRCQGSLIDGGAIASNPITRRRYMFTVAS